LSKLKVGDLVKIKNRREIIDSSKKHQSPVSVERDIENGEYDTIFSFCGKIMKITKITEYCVYTENSKGITWYESDFKPISDQLEFNFEDKE
jgi:hypothetical protein